MGSFFILHIFFCQFFCYGIPKIAIFQAFNYKGNLTVQSFIRRFHGYSSEY